MTNAAQITTTEQAYDHQGKCKAMIKCLHETDQVNEYGDCFDCDGEGVKMCFCQDWTFDFMDSLG